MGIETLAVIAVYSLIEYWLGKSKKIKANSVPEATVERAAMVIVNVAKKIIKKI